jgi:hypothetical protein
LLAQEERHFSDQYDSLDERETTRTPATSIQPEKRRRESESQGTAAQKEQKTRKSTSADLFVPGGSIHKEVIFADIEVYVPGATVRLAEHERRRGYMISQSKEATFGKDELVLMLSDLKADTVNWSKEGGEYKMSMVHKSRHYHGGSYKRP